MSRKLPKKDVVIVGLGWTGSIMANELTDEGLDVIAIERGPWRATLRPNSRQTMPRTSRAIASATSFSSGPIS